MKVAVYCGSQEGKSAVYMEAASELGKVLADNEIGLVYGGAKVGLMGACANAALQNGAEVIGIMPHHLHTTERAHDTLTAFHFVETMHERKAMMAQLADGFIALPGGCGTLDEYFEVFTWAQIGLHEKPVILYNVNGFYDALIAHMDKMLEEGFVRAHQRELFKVATTAQQVMGYLKV